MQVERKRSNSVFEKRSGLPYQPQQLSDLLFKKKNTINDRFPVSNESLTNGNSSLKKLSMKSADESLTAEGKNPSMSNLANESEILKNGHNGTLTNGHTTESHGQNGFAEKSLTNDRPKSTESRSVRNGLSYSEIQREINSKRSQDPQRAEDESDFLPEMVPSQTMAPSKTRALRPKLKYCRSLSAASDSGDDDKSISESITNGHHDSDSNDNCSEESSPPRQIYSRNRRPSAIDLSRDVRQVNRHRKISPVTTPTTEMSTYSSNPDMEIFRMRRSSLQMRRNSLKDLISDWPTLGYIEKPEYRKPEFRVGELSEAQLLELRKMDPSLIYKSDHWIQGLEDQECCQKEPRVTFTCVYSIPNAKIRWFKNTREVFHGHKYNIKNESGTLSLIIFRVDLDDGGRYTCTADDREASVAELVVHERVAQYSFLTKLPECASVREKSDIVLECVLKDPKPSVVWRMNNEVLEYTPQMFDIFRREDRCILKIKNCTPEYNNAEITCTVQGDETRCKLIVDEPDYRFVKFTSDADALEKESAYFECETNWPGAPTQWFKNDEAILTDKKHDKYEILNEGTTRRLVVTNICLADGAIYSCRVQNNSTTAKLYVAPEVTIVERLKNKHVIENESVKLRCKIKNPKNFEIRWFKDNNLIESSERFSIKDKDGRHLSLTITGIQLSDAGSYKCMIGERETQCTLKVEPCLKPVTVDIDMVPREITVRAGRTFEIYVPYSGLPLPSMEWTKDGVRLNEGGEIEWEQTGDTCRIMIMRAARKHCGEYKLTLTNSCSQAAVPITVIVLDKPQAPQGPLEVLDVFEDRCHLRWMPPSDDGGVNINHYLVEYFQTGDEDWTEVGKFDDDTQCGVPCLKAGCMYKFRVRAVNTTGQSEPLCSVAETLAKDPWDPPSRPGKPRIVDFDKDSVDITWTHSLTDGGSPIIKYVIEMKHEADPWKTVGMVLPVAELYAVVPDLEENHTYMFRVCGVNKAGRGEMSEPSVPTRTKATRIAPQIDRGSFLTPLKLKSGQSFKVEVRFSGQPMPKVSWSKHGKKLTSEDGIEITRTVESSILFCKEASRIQHNATYKISVKNEHGSDSAKIDIIVAGVPSAPTGPLSVSTIRSSSAVLTWKEPDDTGGRPLSGYVLEKECVGSNHWEKASSYIPSDITEYRVNKLIEGEYYQFRVRAINDLGTSEPLYTAEAVRAKNPFGCPSCPGRPDVTDSDTTFISLAWTAPVSDGGAPVLGYLVERWERTTDVWNRVTDKLVETCEYEDTRVQQSKVYRYRVVALNEGGESEASEESDLVRARPFREIPRVLLSRQSPDSGWSSSSGSNRGGSRDSSLSKSWNGWEALAKKYGLGEGVELLVVKAGEPIRLDLEFCGSPAPCLTWTKDGHSLETSSRHLLDTTDNICHLFIAMSERHDTGLYSLTLSNELGQSSFETFVVVLDKPGPPQNVRAEDVTSDRCLLVWSCPLDDGDSDITGYIVEMCEVDTGLWIRLPQLLTDSLQYLVKDLMCGSTYRFCVRAVNLEGTSEPAYLKDTVTTKEPHAKAGPPGKPFVIDSNIDFIKISWSCPTYEEESPIIGYNIYRTQSDFVSRWIQLPSNHSQELTYTDEEVSEGHCYEYKVTAVTAGGESRSSEVSDPIKAKPFSEPPKFHVLKAEVSGLTASHVMSELGHLEVKVRFGHSLTLNIPLSGSPQPTVTQNKDGLLLPPTSAMKITNTEERFTLYLQEMKRNHSGSYAITATNQHGQDNASIMLIVQDVPGPVSSLHVTSIEEDRCTLIWDKLHNDGGTEITEYLLDYSTEDDGRWRCGVTVFGGESSVTIRDLTPGVRYRFRIRAKNCVGTGEAKETENFHQTLLPMIGPSFEDNSVEFTVMEGDSLKEKIVCGGGRPLSISLTRENGHTSEISDKRIRIKELDDNSVLLSFKDIVRADAGSYIIRATNGSGLEAKLYCNLHVKGTCGPCTGPLLVTHVTNTGCSLTWRLPVDDGGCKILHYTVEKKEEGKDFWSPAVPATKHMDVSTQGLVQGKWYQFRVSAVNAIGRGAWLYTEKPVKAKLPYGPPLPPESIHISEVSQNSVLVSWKISRGFNMEHITGYQVEKRCVSGPRSDSEVWVKAVSVTSSMQTSSTVGNLLVDHEYEFRVLALNEAGESAPSDVSPVIMIKELDGGSLPQFIVGLNSMECSRGSDVRLNVEVTGSPEPSVIWYAGTQEIPIMSSKYEISRNGRKHSLIIRQLTDEDSDEISAKVVNTAGSKVTRANITVKSPPRILVPVLFQQPSVHDKGQTVKVTLGVRGYPKPKVSWSKKSLDGRLSDVVNTESSCRYETLVIDKADRNDSAVYILHAENNLGEDTAEVKIIINDVAEAPSGLTVVSCTHNSVSLSWKPPASDGGSVVTQYVIESYQAVTSSWIKSVYSRYNDAVVPHLKENTEYQYRVLAENIYGLSDPSNTVTVFTKGNESENSRSNGTRSRRNSMQSGHGSSTFDKFYHDLWKDYKPVQVEFSLDNFYDHYDLVEELGSNASGTVYRAVEKETGRSFVARISRIESVLEKNAIRNEMNILNQLHDPKILQLYDAFDNKEEIILVMEYLSGGDLLERCCDDDHKMTESEVIHYIKQICEILTVIHDLNIVHLDLKLENLLHKTRSSRDIKLINFGLATKLNPDDSVTVSMAAPDYSAPEIINRDPVGFYTDMWSVGLLSYALLSGQLPFSGKDDSETARNVSRGFWRFDKESFEDVSEKAKDFITKLLIKNPEQRMTVHQALDHDWLKSGGSHLTKRIPAERYSQLRDQINTTQTGWLVKSSGIGILSNVSSLGKLRPKENKMYQSYFDRREAVPRFIRRPHDSVVEEGGVVILKCQINSPSPPLVTWYFNNTALTPGIKYLPRYSGKNYEIKICRVKMEDMGEYTVRAENSWGKAERTVFINVQEAEVPRRHLTRSRSVEPESLRSRERNRDLADLDGKKKNSSAPSFSFALRDRRLQDGVDVKLIACVDGNPAPQITWKKDGEEIEDNQYKYRKSSQTGICTLEIRDCKVRDAGKYSCVATNSNGTDETSCNISVQGHLDPVPNFSLPVASSYNSFASFPSSSSSSRYSSPYKGRMRKRNSIAGF